MILYHGSNCDIAKIDFTMCKPFKDFGQSFYLTSILTQAREMSRKVADRFGGMPVVNVFDFDETGLPNLNVKIFNHPDREWAEFVMANRSRCEKHPADDFDLIIGPVANDTTMPVINMYLEGRYEENEALRRLLPQKLKDQYTFKTIEAINLLKFVEEIRL